MRTGLGKRGSQRVRPTAKTKAAQTGSCRPRRMAKAKLKGGVYARWRRGTAKMICLSRSSSTGLMRWT